MVALTSRAYAGQADLQAMIDLLAAARPADRIADYPGPSDLREILAMPRVQEGARLWVDARGQVVGFAIVDPFSNLWFELDPRATGPEAASEVVAWSEVLARRAGMAKLDTNCREDDLRRIALLERHGFQAQALRTLRMVRSLHEPIPAPRLPAGYLMRHVTGEDEVEALVALHRAAFGTDHMTVEERRAMMGVPDYDPELDLLVVAPDGRLAATCMGSISEEENRSSGRNEGYTDPVATHPDYQRRGLARALLLTALFKLQERGMDAAILGTSSSNLPMRRAAQSVGFRVQWTKCWYSKPLTRTAGALAAPSQR